jgi:hypothetical protein
VVTDGIMKNKHANKKVMVNGKVSEKLDEL